MNILIPDSWLREYLKTKANPKKISQCLSLCGASVERIIKKNNDYIYDVEITSNRVDMASILGFAREGAAILPQFNIKAKLKKDPYQISKTKNQKPLKPHNARKIKEKKLKVIIKNHKLCPRFTTIILDNINIKPSPKIIQQRLEKVGVRSLNNIIDISNYLMHELGQPIHVFDYDKIGRKTMILRESKKGEKIVTIDGKTHLLPGKDIVIEDGEGRLIDLCGIMGGKNSCVDKKTKRVLLFVQNYEPMHIRRTSMLLAHRTEAASLFEKGIDPELVMPVINKGIQLIKEIANGKTASQIIDIYPSAYKQKIIKIPLQLIKDYLGIPIRLTKVINILESLGFKSSHLIGEQAIIQVTVPSWRSDDVSFPEDLIEEVARIYGYHNLPSQLPSGELSHKLAKQNFSLELKIKNCLADWGYTEIKTYSMQSKIQIKNCSLNPKNHLKIINPLTEELVYMRRSLIPSFLDAIARNKIQKVKFFELSKIYLKRNKKLPKEELSLIIGQNGKNQYYYLKGIMSVLLKKFNIKQYQLQTNSNSLLLNHQKSAQIYCKKQLLGTIGKINQKIINNFSLKSPVTVLLLNFSLLDNCRQTAKIFTPLTKHQSIIEDLSFTLKTKVYYDHFVRLIKSCSSLIKQVKLLDSYQNNRTFRIIYQHPRKNLSTLDISHIRKKIIQAIEMKGWGKLKEQGID